MRVRDKKTFYFEFLGIENNQSQFAWWIEPQETKQLTKFAPVNAAQVLRRMASFLKKETNPEVKAVNLFQ